MIHDLNCCELNESGFYSKELAERSWIRVGFGRLVADRWFVAYANIGKSVINHYGVCCIATYVMFMLCAPHATRWSIRWKDNRREEIVKVKSLFGRTVEKLWRVFITIDKQTGVGNIRFSGLIVVRISGTLIFEHEQEGETQDKKFWSECFHIQWFDFNLHVQGRKFTHEVQWKYRSNDFVQAMDSFLSDGTRCPIGSCINELHPVFGKSSCISVRYSVNCLRRVHKLNAHHQLFSEGRW